jgi:hypothetical protein
VQDIVITPEEAIKENLPNNAAPAGRKKGCFYFSEGTKRETPLFRIPAQSPLFIVLGNHFSISIIQMHHFG